MSTLPASTSLSLASKVADDNCSGVLCGVAALSARATGASFVQVTVIVNTALERAPWSSVAV